MGDRPVVTVAPPPVPGVAPVSDPPVRRLGRWPLVLLTVFVVMLSVAPAVVTTILAGEAPYDRIFVSFPGLDVAISTGAGQGVADLSSTVTVGAVLWILFFRNVRGRDASRMAGSVELTVLQVASAAWATSAGAMIVLEMLDSSGIPFSRLGEPGAMSFLYDASAFPRAWTVAFVAAMVTFGASMFTERWTGLLIPLWASVFGVLAPVAVGQILVGPNHDFGSDAGIYQTLLTSAAFGLLLVGAARVLTGRLIDPLILWRLGKTLAVLLPVIVASDLLLAWFKLAGTGLLESVTGWQILIRGLFLLGVVSITATGWVWGRRGRLTAHRITGLLVVTTVMIGGWLGVTTAMTRIPPPQYFAPTSISQVFLGFEVLDPPTALVLFTQWRPNILFLVAAIAAVTVYLWAVRRVRLRGDAWPAGRTAAWVAGWAVVVFVTSSGFGKYSAPDFGVHMIVHMSLNMAAPILLVLGGVITLLLRATRSDPARPVGMHDWITWVLHWPVLRFVFNPLIVFILFVGSYYGLYFTGIFGEFMRFHWAHQLMNVHFLIAGYLFYALVIGVDRPPRPLPHIGKLGFVLAAMPFHAFFGVILMTGNMLIAEDFYRYFGLPWSDLPAAQYFAGGVAWAGGEIPLLLVIIALGIQWSRQDAKDARRKDRHLDTGRDDEFDQYNRMLEQLAARGVARPAPRTVEENDT